MKLFSLKYTPNTATAVDEPRNTPSIKFIPNVITEPTDAIIIDGTPTARIVFM